MLTLVQTVVPALVIFVTLFGLMARGDPKPGGVALFFRVGLVGLVLGAGLFFLVEKTAVVAGRPAIAVDIYRGLVGGGILLLAFAGFGQVLKRRP